MQKLKLGIYLSEPFNTNSIAFKESVSNSEICALTIRTLVLSAKIEKNEGSSDKLKAGLVAGAAVIVIISMLIGFCIWRRNFRRKGKQTPKWKLLRSNRLGYFLIFHCIYVNWLKRSFSFCFFGINNFQYLAAIRAPIHTNQVRWTPIGARLSKRLFFHT